MRMDYAGPISTRSMACAVSCAAVIYCGSAGAQDRLVSSVLRVSAITLDTSVWILDEEKVDADGDRFFYADARDPAAGLQVRVSEILVSASNNTYADKVAASAAYLASLQSKSKYFKVLPCPDAFRPAPTWHCVAYHSNLFRPRAEATAVMHVTFHNGARVHRMVKFNVEADAATQAHAAGALEAVTLK